jgi:transcriptional regulator with XRE-family HTH domain
MNVNTKGKRVVEVNLALERKIKGRNWTMQYVADQIGITVSAINDIEKGRCKPSYDVYLKLMSLFGYKAPHLVFGEPDGEPSDPCKSIPRTQEVKNVSKHAHGSN